MGLFSNHINVFSFPSQLKFAIFNFNLLPICHFNITFPVFIHLTMIIFGDGVKRTWFIYHLKCELSSVGPAVSSVFNWSRFRTESTPWICSYFKNWILLLYFCYSRWYFSISAVSLNSVNIWRVGNLMWIQIKNGVNETEDKTVFVFGCWRWKSVLQTDSDCGHHGFYYLINYFFPQRNR